MRVAGLGFRQGATHWALADALEKARAVAGEAPITALATHITKSKHPAIQELALKFALPVLSLDEAALSSAQTKTQSERVAALFGTGSIAEAAALAAVGAGARLLCPRMISSDGMAVAAIAEGAGP